jgi:hypothetical protein
VRVYTRRKAIVEPVRCLARSSMRAFRQPPLHGLGQLHGEWHLWNFYMIY